MKKYNKKPLLFLSLFILSIIPISLLTVFLFWKEEIILSFFNNQKNTTQAIAQILPGNPSAFTVKKQDGCNCTSLNECFGGYCCFSPGIGSVCQSTPCPATISNLSSNFSFACSQSRIPRLSWDTSAAFPYDFEIQICSDVNCDNILVSELKTGSYNSFWSASCFGQCDLTPYNQIQFGERTYYWRIRIKDAGGSWSNWSQSTFITLKNPYPIVSFTCNDKACADIQPSAGESVILKNTSLSFTDTSICRWTITPSDAYSIEEGDLNSCELKLRIKQNENLNINLAITDASGYTCDTDQSLKAKPRLPFWREIFE